MPESRAERLLYGTNRPSRWLLGVALPLLFDAAVLSADVAEGPKTAFVGLLATAPMISAIFGDLGMVMLTSLATWLAAFGFGLLASDGNSTAQSVRLLAIAMISVVACISAAVRIRRESKYMDALVRNAEAASLQKLAHTDVMTGLLNRRGFIAAHSKSNLDVTTLAIVDVDGLKSVNDQFGHPAGDELIIAVAHRIRRHFREDDHIARWGGDEFVIELHSAPDEAYPSLQRVIENICSDPVLINGRAVRLAVSAGMAAWPRETHFDEAFRVADKRMYAAKQQGGAQILGEY